VSGVAASPGGAARNLLPRALSSELDLPQFPHQHPVATEWGAGARAPVGASVGTFVVASAAAHIDRAPPPPPRER